MTEVKRAGETRNLFRSIYYKLYKPTPAFSETCGSVGRTAEYSVTITEHGEALASRSQEGVFPMHPASFRCVPTISVLRVVVWRTSRAAYQTNRVLPRSEAEQRLGCKEDLEGVDQVR